MNVITFDLKPIAKERPRLPKNGGPSFTPQRTKRFQADVGAVWVSSGGLLTPGDVEVGIHLRRNDFDVTVSSISNLTHSSLRGDIDNYAKAILDGLNGIAFEDDKLVRRLTVTK